MLIFFLLKLIDIAGKIAQHKRTDTWHSIFYTYIRHIDVNLSIFPLFKNPSLKFTCKKKNKEMNACFCFQILS